MTPSGEPRVLLLLDSLAPGGAERSTVTLLPHLTERGFDLELATLHDRDGLAAEVRAMGVELHDLSGSGGRAGWLRRTRALLTERRPDLVHTSLFEADIAGRVAAFSARIPVVSTLPTERYGEAHLRAPHLDARKVRLSQVLDGATARLAVRLHAVTTHVADSMAHHLRYPRHRIDVIHRGRPAPSIPAFSTPGAAEARATLRRSVRASLDLGERPTVLAVARHEQAKGLDRLIDAMADIVADRPDAVLLIAGREGAQSDDLRARLEQERLTGAVRILGHRDDVDELHVASDVFVLPSRREGLPGSLLEAMACGTPSVVNDLPNLREIVGSTEAVAVDAADNAALAAAVLGLLADPKHALALAEAARQRFESTFTLERSADGMAEFYRRSLGLTDPSAS